MIRIIHLSDLHMHKTRSKADNRNAETLVTHIRRQFHGLPKNKTYVVLTGDCVDDSAANQFRQLTRRVLEPLSADFTVLAVPGNHDYAYVGNLYTKKGRQRFRDYVGPYVGPGASPWVSANDDEYVLFFGLDSADPGDEKWFAEGVIGTRQLGALKDVLSDDAYRDYFKIAYLHHHPFYRKIGLALADYADFLDAIQRGRVHLVLFGHKHNSEAFFGRFQVPLMLASGKVSETSGGEALAFRVIEIEHGQPADLYTEEVPSADSTQIFA